MTTKGIPHHRYEKLGKSYAEYLEEEEEKESNQKNNES